MNIAIIDYGAGNLRSVARAVAHVGFEARVTSDPRDVDAADKVIMPGVGAAADTMRNLRACGMVEPVRAYIASGRPFFGVCMGQQALLSVSEEGGEHECLGVIPGRVVRLPRGEEEEEGRGRGGAAQGAAGAEEEEEHRGRGGAAQCAERKAQGGGTNDAAQGAAGAEEEEENRGRGGAAQGAERKAQGGGDAAQGAERKAQGGGTNGNGFRLKVPHMGWNRVRQVREHAIFDGIDDGAYFYFVHSYYPAPEDREVVIGETEYGVTFASVLARDNIVATQFHPEKSGEAGLRMYANFLRGA